MIKALNRTISLDVCAVMYSDKLVYSINTQKRENSDFQKNKKALRAK